MGVEPRVSTTKANALTTELPSICHPLVSPPLPKVRQDLLEKPVLELIALLNLSSWCLVMVERLFLTVPRGCLQFVIVVFPDHTHLLFFISTVSARYSSAVAVITRLCY